MQYFTKGVQENQAKKKKGKKGPKAGETRAQALPAPLKTNNMGQHDPGKKRPGEEGDGTYDNRDDRSDSQGDNAHISGKERFIQNTSQDSGRDPRGSRKSIIH